MTEGSLTIRDVAQRAGVSVATVSRVLSGKGQVHPNTRERVQAAVREMGYRPSRIARGFRAQRSSFIGLLISDVENPFHTSLARAIEDLAYAHDYRLLLCNTDEDLEREQAYLHFLADERVSGVICAPASESRTSFRALLDAGIPVVTVDRVATQTPVDNVRLDNITAARALTQHLLARGHRRIALLGLPTDITSGRERLEGFEQAMRAAGVPVERALVRLGKGVEPFGLHAARELLSQPDCPTALLTANNMITLGAMKAIRQLGLSMPDDVDLAGFDETPWLSLLNPTMLIAAQPIREMGRIAVEMLLSRLRGDRQPPRTVLLPAQIVSHAPDWAIPLDGTQGGDV